MKKLYIALALAGIIAFAVLAEAGENGIGVKDKIGKLFRHRWHHRCEGSNESKNMWHHDAWRNMLNYTRIEGVLEYQDGVYVVNGVELYVGNEVFLNSIARSDFDRDGEYEYVWQELEGLIGTEVVVNGVLRDGTLYVSHINGIWFRMPRALPELVEMNGVLEYINESYYINDTQLIIKHGLSKSDIDGDGSLETMYEELNGLVGKEITVDGFVNEKGFVVMHINGIWAR